MTTLNCILFKPTLRYKMDFANDMLVSDTLNQARHDHNCLKRVLMDVISMNNPIIKSNGRTCDWDLESLLTTALCSNDKFYGVGTGWNDRYEGKHCVILIIF